MENPESLSSFPPFCTSRLGHQGSDNLGCGLKAVSPQVDEPRYLYSHCNSISLVKPRLPPLCELPLSQAQHSPVDLAVGKVTPVYSIGSYFHVQCHDVLEHGNEARVVPLHQVYSPYLVSVREDQGWALASCHTGRQCQWRKQAA